MIKVMIITKTKEVNNKKRSKMITKRTMIVVKYEEEVEEEEEVEKEDKMETIKMRIKRLSLKKNTKRSLIDRYLMIQTILKKKKRRMVKETINKEEEVVVVINR